MKLWQKDKGAQPAVESFTCGKDREMDLAIASFDVIGSIAHAKMLGKVGLLSPQEEVLICSELRKIYIKTKEPGFQLERGVEDIHSQVELFLTRALGDTGKKVHSARSRNDQVLVDLKLFMRREIREIVDKTGLLFDLLIKLSEKHKEEGLPGYTHFQLAMPSSFGLWFGAYAESLVDDLITLEAAYRIVNKNPLGSAAGYGSSFPIDRSMTASLLGFEGLANNVVYAQMGRGKTEKIVSMAIANIAASLSKLSMDCCLYLNQQFAFISFPEELTTGSSIMPHKKNPDVFELIRAHANRLQALPNEIALITSNLPSGYHRDLQLIKEHMVPAFDDLKNCLSMMILMMENIEVRQGLLNDPKYDLLYSVEAVNQLVLSGTAFRDAYRQVAANIEKGDFKRPDSVPHTHEGAVGNLQNEVIRSNMNEVLAMFNFEKVDLALKRLLSEQ